VEEKIEIVRRPFRDLGGIDFRFRRLIGRRNNRQGARRDCQD
jgi:hypothetical protein